MLPFLLRLKYLVRRQAMTLQRGSQALQGIDLDLAHSLTRQTNFSPNILKCGRLMAAKSEATGYDIALLF